MTTRIVALADMHVGSAVGLALPDETPNDCWRKVRRAIYGAWERCVDRYGGPDVLIVNGDIVDGQNRKKAGACIWTTDLMAQADMAAELLGKWKAGKIFVIRGSDYHVDAGNSGLNVEEIVARNICAEEYPHQEDVQVDRRNHSGAHWYITIEDVTFHVSHKISISRVFHYQSTPTARQMLQAQLNNQLRHEMGNAKIKIVLRAHAHYFNALAFSGSFGCVQPCWKALDEYMVANGPLDISPDLGLLQFIVDGENYSYEKCLFHLSDVQKAPRSIVHIGGKSL